MKHTILFLAANPLGTDRIALDREARAIQVELERSGFRDRLELVTRWAAEPLDLLRELRKLKPTVVHFSGHGTAGVASQAPRLEPHRDVDIEPGHNGGNPPSGLFFQGPDGGLQLVSTEALEATFGAAGSSVKLIVLSACYSELNAQALLCHVSCVVGMSGAIADEAAQSFAIGFYGGLGERESIAAAYEQGCAAISLQGLSEHDRPKLAVRAGIDAGKLVLAADPEEAPSSHAATDTAGHSPTNRQRPRQAPSPQVDIGILTIRDDEFRAVLQMFPTKTGVTPGAHREYTLRHAEAGDGERYTITVLRQVEQGLGEAQTVARDLIEDLAPRLVLVVGIAGALPSDDITLGDVVLSTRIHDFTVEARKAGHEVTYAATGGPIDKALANAVADLANREDVLGKWTADLPARPPVAWTRKRQLEGPPEWQRELRARLEHHHGKGAAPRAPVYVAGPIASSDRLVKDPAVLIPWLTTARNLLAVEMESGGVYRAVRERCSMLAIRGISDIVGLKRSDAWTKYACASAAAFTRAFLRTRPIELSAAAGTTIESPHARNKIDQTQPRHDTYVAARGVTQLDLDDEQPFGDDGRAAGRAPWWRMLAADVIIVGVCVALTVWGQREQSQDPDPPVNLPNMARFQAADVYLGVFAAFPDDCRQLPLDENCAEWRHPESVRATHIAAFELDRKETTNDEFCAWLNNHANDWSLETDGVVTDRKKHLPLLATTDCIGAQSISPDGRAESTASGAQQPVTCVTWYGAEMYCGAQNKRLPLEAEWELAAKGVTGRPFPWEGGADHLDGVAYHLTGPRAVGTSATDVSPEGVYDLAGNVAEWVQSERNTPDRRVVRGGSYLSDGACRLLGSKCARISVKNVGRNVGFRCARDANEQLQAQERTR